MISRRNFFSIFLMMAVVFIMFQFSQIVIDKSGEFDVNAFVPKDEEILSGENVWQVNNDNYLLNENGYVLYVSPEESEVDNIITQWCTYTKRGYVKKDTLENLQLSSTLPELILLDGANLEYGINCKWLLDLTEYKVPLIFCTIPDSKEIKYTTNLRSVLGIKEVRALETEVEGIYLFDDFFLGGECLYEAETEKELKRQDMDLSVPWYVTVSGTKAYMVGLKDAKVVEREEFPVLLWRNYYNGTYVCVVCGDYMSDLAGLGILDAFVYELNSYQIYPVVNSQNVVIANFPGFAEENADKIMEIYSRGPGQTFQDVMWPSIASMANTNNLKLSCLFNPQYDYLDNNYPTAESVEFYLRQLKQINAEAGYSLKYRDNTDFQTVVTEDKLFFDTLNSTYAYQTMYTEEKDMEYILQNAENNELLRDINTISMKYTQEYPLLSYVNSDITLQLSTGNARKHSYMDNFTTKSLLTALGYSNVLLDLHPSLWPTSIQDQWQYLYDDMSSNVHTYWSGGLNFERTTLSESDKKVRSFLNLNYKHNRADNKIILEADNYGQEAWFVLRTHDEKIVSMTGGTYYELEQNAYLIKVLEKRVEINLKELTLQEQGAKTW